VIASTIADFVDELERQHGVRLWLQEGKLRYRAPKGGLTESLRQDLLSRKEEILDYLGGEEASGEADGPSLPVVIPAPAERHEPFPMLEMQQAYWIGGLGELDLGSVSANTYIETHLRDEPDVGRLEHAWNRVIERHEMLRAVVLEDGRFQILPEVPRYEIARYDWRDLPSDDVEARLEVLRERLSHQGPSVDNWPLFKVSVSYHPDGSIYLHLALSLLICDALSVGVLGRELGRLYREPEATFPDLELSFRDVALAVREFESSAVYTRSLRYWRERLATLPPAPELPLVKNPAEVRRPILTQRLAVLAPELWERFKERAKRAGVTPTAAAFAACSEVLAGWSKNRRFTLSVLFFNRFPIHPQIHDVVGNFSTIVLLEVDASGNMPFEERARRLQQQMWRDLEHNQVGGVQVLRDLNRQRGTGARVALPVAFTSTVNLFAKPAPESTGEQRPEEGGRLRGESFEHTQIPQVWLDHQITEDQGELVFEWDSVDELFPPGMLDSMFEVYRGVLHRLSREEESWDRPLGDLRPAEEVARVERANATAAPLPDDLLHAPFHERAERSPEALALQSAEHAFTYAELAGLARSLAGRLADAGAGPGQRVAVVMHKGWEQVVAVLAILEAGAAYLPIDASLPRGRREYLLSHGEVGWVLTQGELAEGLEWPPEVRLFAVEKTPPQSPQPPPAPSVRPDDLAYVIFTSGSTGRPKGVMIEHRGALNTVLDVNRSHGVGTGDRVLALSSLSFDLSVYDVFGTLAAGGAVVMPEPGMGREPDRLLSFMEETGVTVWNSVPALMELVVDHAETAGCALPESLRLVLLSGDWIPVSLPERIRALGQGIEVISMGGATEASIWSIRFPIGEVDPSWRSIPYGRPMGNQRFYVLDERLEVCPAWVAGELHIAGAGLARGYWRDGEKTAASFFDHPHTGERLYRTGDLGRYLPDGEIEFLGREDNQVKVQGYRIELGEIEHALLQHPGVKNAVVQAVGEDRGQKRLVAYVISEEDAFPADNLPAEELKDFLRTTLPDYMVPRVWFQLEALPLTANGKVDRKALAPPSEEGSGERMAVAPRDEVERELLELWREMLGAETELGVHDDFFECGGHSVLAVQMMMRLRQRWQRELPLRTLLEGPTVAELAAALRGEEAPAGGEVSPLVLLRSGDDSAVPFFCVHPSGGNVACYVALAGHLAQLAGSEAPPFYGLQCPAVEGGALLGDVEEIAGRYLDAVRGLVGEAPLRLGGWSMGGVVAYEMARQATARGGEVASLTLIDATAGAGPATEEPEDETLLGHFLRDLEGLAGRSLPGGLDAVLAGGGDPAVALADAARAAGLLPREIATDYIVRMLEVFQTNYRAMLRYRPGPYGGRLLLLRARGGELAHGASADGAEGWARHGAEVRVVDLPGDHYSIVREPHVASLAEHLGAELRAAEPVR